MISIRRQWKCFANMYFENMNIPTLDKSADFYKPQYS